MQSERHLDPKQGVNILLLFLYKVVCSSTQTVSKDVSYLHKSHDTQIEIPFERCGYRPRVRPSRIKLQLLLDNSGFGQKLLNFLNLSLGKLGDNDSILPDRFQWGISYKALSSVWQKKRFISVNYCEWYSNKFYFKKLIAVY